jgi:hypothetical protein
VNNVVTYAAIIDAPNPELKLKPGMTANVTIEVARRDAVLRVPAAALRFKPDAKLLASLGATAPAGKGSVVGSRMATRSRHHGEGRRHGWLLHGTRRPGIARGNQDRHSRHRGIVHDAVTIAGSDEQPADALAPARAASLISRVLRENGLRPHARH